MSRPCAPTAAPCSAFKIGHKNLSRSTHGGGTRRPTCYLCVCARVCARACACCVHSITIAAPQRSKARPVILLLGLRPRSAPSFPAPPSPIASCSPHRRTPSTATIALGKRSHAQRPTIPIQMRLAHPNCHSRVFSSSFPSSPFSPSCATSPWPTLRTPARQRQRDIADSRRACVYRYLCC